MSLLRRSFLKTLPLASASPKWAFSMGQTEGVVASDRTALEVVRMFNTMEAHHYLKLGTYGDMRELLRFVPASWFATKRENPSSKDFFLQLHPGEDEVISGWTLSLTKTLTGAGYFMSLARLNPADLLHNSVYVSDNIGIIMIGGPGAVWEVPNPETATASSIPGLHSIESDPILNKKPGVLRKLAFAAMSAQSPPLIDCNCSCTCLGGTQCFCHNLGCQSNGCIWCCSGSCVGCALCNHYQNCTCCF